MCLCSAGQLQTEGQKPHLSQFREKNLWRPKAPVGLNSEVKNKNTSSCLSTQNPVGTSQSCTGDHQSTEKRPRKRKVDVFEYLAEGRSSYTFGLLSWSLDY